MRSILTIAFLHFALLSFGQIKLDGMYDQEYGFRIIFKNDSLFEYVDGQAREILGRGVFKIDGNELILRFINHDTLSGSIEIIGRDCETDSILLSVHIRSRIAKEPLPFAFISLTDSSNIENYKTADYNGNALFTLKANPRSKKPVKYKIECRYAFCEGFKASINVERCEDISIGLMDQKCTIEDGTIWKYKIVKVTNKELVLKENRPFTLFRPSTVNLHRINW